MFPECTPPHRWHSRSTLSKQKFGGGGSHRRTCLCRPFPCSTGKYREFLVILPFDLAEPASFAPTIMWLRRNSLHKGTGNFLEASGNYRWVIREIQLSHCGRSECPLWGVERTCLVRALMSASDPKRTLVADPSFAAYSKAEFGTLLAFEPNTSSSRPRGKRSALMPIRTLEGDSDEDDIRCNSAH